MHSAISNIFDLSPIEKQGILYRMMECIFLNAFIDNTTLKV